MLLQPIHSQSLLFISIMPSFFLYKVSSAPRPPPKSRIHDEGLLLLSPHLWSTPQPKKKSGIMTTADSEVKPLLATGYDATSTLKMKKHRGRGKLRFSMRQQMKNNSIRSRSTGSIYNSVFTPKHNKVEQRSFVSKNGRMKSSNIKPDEENSTTKHTKLYNTLNPKSRIPSAQLYQKIITCVILFDAIIFILSTEPNLSQYNNTFYIIEAITSTIFAIEYFARLLVCTEKKSYAKYGRIRGRWRYMCSWQALLDAFGKCK